MRNSKEGWFLLSSSKHSLPRTSISCVNLKPKQVVAQTGEIVARLANVTLEGFKDVNAKINALVDSQIRTDENLSRTDENLRNLIVVVDRYFSEGRNGRWRASPSY